MVISKKKNLSLINKIEKIIPGGAHTYSRGSDQFSENVPQILTRGKGAYLFYKKKKFLDFGMGLRSVNIGYAENKINQSAISQINKGNNLTRPSEIEYEAAKKLVNLIDSVDMVKFTKNGSSAVTAAVKLARAYTKKEYVLRCKQQPFFSYDDWFIGSTVIKKGITKDTIKKTIFFDYNDIESIKKNISKYKNKIACIVLEPAFTECPRQNNQSGCCSNKKCDRAFKKKSNFLKDVGKICKRNKIIFILDEMITGFRWHLKGAQFMYGIKPDLSTFGKAMANGFSVAAVGGKKKIMNLGSIDKKNRERLFLLSTTHGAEMSGLGAFVETLKYLKKNDVIKKNWYFGYKLKNEMNSISKKHGLINYFKVLGPSCSPYYVCKNKKFEISQEFKTLFIQEMFKHGVLIPWISICYKHGNKEIKIVRNALEKTLKVYKLALKKGAKKYINGKIVKPVFRKFN